MPRELPGPHQPHLLSAVDTHLLLRCDESTAGTGLSDEAGGATFTDVGTVGVQGGLFTSPAGARGARTLDGATQYQTRAGTTADLNVVQASDVTVEAWLTVSSLAGTGTLIGYGSASTSSAGNYQIQLAVTAAGELRWFWERASSVNVIGTTTGAGVTTGSVYHTALVRSAPASGTAGKCDVIVYLNGEPVTTWSDQDLPTGGTAAGWSVGASSTPSEFYAGALDDIRVSKFAATAEMIRDSYERGLRDYDIGTVYDSQGYEAHARLLIEDGAGAFIDVTTLEDMDWLESLEWGDNVDDQGASVSFSLQREAYALSMVPWMQASKLNLLGDLLGLKRRFKVEVAVVPDGTGKAGVGNDWHPAVDGFITGYNPASTPIKVTGMDRMAELQDTWIEPDGTSTPPIDRVYGTTAGTAVEGELQLVIDDAEPSGGYAGGKPDLYTPISPAWNVKDWRVAPAKNVAQELEDVVALIGWMLRYKWDDHRKTPRLTLFEPDRASTWSSGDLLFTAGEVLDATKLEVSRDDIRNVCEVEYGDATTTDTTQTIQRATVTASNAASISKYGRRYCRIGEPSTGQISDAAQAQALADAVVADLKEPKATYDVKVGFRHQVELGDMVRFEADGLHFDTAQDFAVVAYRHRFARGAHSTTLTCRGDAPVARRFKYLEILQASGVTEVAGLSPPLAAAGVTLTRLVGGVLVEWAFPTNRGNGAYRETEVHVGSSSGFTPSSSTLASVIRGRRSTVLDLDPESGLQYVKVAHRDYMKNVSAYSAVLSATPRFLLAIPAARVFRGTTSQSISAGITAVALNNEDYDVGGHYTPGTYRWKCPRAGVAHIDATIELDFSGKTNSRARLLVYDITGAAYRSRGPWVDTYSTAAVGETAKVLVMLSADFRCPTASSNFELRVEVDDAATVIGAAAAADSPSWATWRLVSED